MRQLVPLGAIRSFTIGEPTVSSDDTTMTLYAKNVDTGEVNALGSADGDAAGEDVVITGQFTAANGLAVGDIIELQANNGTDRFAPNDAYPAPIVIEIIENLA